jgi:hypothetical protein
MRFGRSERWHRLRQMFGLPDKWLPPMASDATLDIPANLITVETQRLIRAYHAIYYEKVRLLILRIARTICLDDVADAYPSKNQQYRWLAEAYFRMPPDMQPNFLAIVEGLYKANYGDHAGDAP